MDDNHDNSRDRISKAPKQRCDKGSLRLTGSGVSRKVYSKFERATDGCVDSILDELEIVSPKPEW